MKPTQIAVLLASLAFAPFVSAQVVLSSEIEGTLTAITPGTTSVELKVMDTRVSVPATAVISSPTRDDLTLADLTSTTRFPGRDKDGFLGGTAIVIGTVNAAGLLTATSVVVEPAENVVLGIATPRLVTDPVGTIRANGMLVKPLNDPRIRLGAPLNDLGFEIALPAILPGTALAIEGYYSELDNAFYAFSLNAVGVPAASPALQASVLLANGRTARGELTVNGAVSGATGTAPVTVQIFRVRPDGVVDTRIATVTATADVLPGTFTYSFTGRGVSPFPTRVVARVVRGTVTATSSIATVNAR